MSISRHIRIICPLTCDIVQDMKVLSHQVGTIKCRQWPKLSLSLSLEGGVEVDSNNLSLYSTVAGGAVCIGEG